jgi:hypothetical protein
MTRHRASIIWHDINTKDIFTLPYTPLEMAISECESSRYFTIYIWLFSGVTGREPIEELNKRFSDQMLYEYGLEAIDKDQIKWFIELIVKYRNIGPNTYFNQLKASPLSPMAVKELNERMKEISNKIYFLRFLIFHCFLNLIFYFIFIKTQDYLVLVKLFFLLLWPSWLLYLIFAPKR